MNCECWHFSKSQRPYRNTKLSISVGVRGTEVLATTQALDVRSGHGIKALIWGMTWEAEKKYYSWRHIYIEDVKSFGSTFKHYNLNLFSIKKDTKMQNFHLHSPWSKYEIKYQCIEFENKIVKFTSLYDKTTWNNCIAFCKSIPL